MECNHLSNPPLVEAIFELKWELQQKSVNTPPTEPHYQILVGSLYDKIKERYPFHEQMPSVMMPADMAAYIIQHRFRKGENLWPLIQLGPGIFTLNETENYSWDNFYNEIEYSLDKLYESYPEKNNIKIKSLKLRYLDAIDFEYKNNILDFLETNMNIRLEMPKSLFNKTNVHNIPNGFDIRFSYPVPELGNAAIRLTRGENNKKTAIIWETNIETGIDEIPKNKNEITDWIKNSHEICHQWFLNLCEGELLEKFK